MEGTDSAEADSAEADSAEGADSAEADSAEEDSVEGADSAKAYSAEGTDSAEAAVDLASVALVRVVAAAKARGTAGCIHRNRSNATLLRLRRSSTLLRRACSKECPGRTPGR